MRANLHWPLRFSVVILITIISALLFFSSVGRSVEQIFFDHFTRWQLHAQAPSEVVIIDIDEQSLQQIGHWPWPRAVMAKLLKQLSDHYAVKSIGLDMVFPEAQHPEGDRLFAQAVRDTGACVGQAFDFNLHQRIRVGQLGKGEAWSEVAQVATGYVGNFPLLAQWGTCFGHITPVLDTDGLIRHIYTQIRWQDQGWFYLAAAMTGHWGMDQAYTPIPYRIQPDAWQAVSAGDVLLGKVPSKLLEGKYVLIGSSSLGLADKVATPVHPWLPGVVIHAELLDGLLHPLPTPPQFLSYIPYGVGGILSLLIMFSLAYQRLRLALFILLVGFGGWMIASYYLWMARQPFAITYPLVVGLISFLVLLMLEWHWSLRQQRRVVKLFRNYVAPSVVDRLLQTSDPETILRPQKRMITLMFADISGFTALSKKLPPEQLAQLTQRLLSLMTQVIHRYEGTVDKYIGDAVMAFWNAPLDQPDHMARALDCAFEILWEVECWNEENMFGQPMRVHVALHSGEVLVGNLGTDFRHAYTAIGQMVNEAERLLHQGDRPDRIVVSPQIRQQLVDRDWSDERLMVGKV